jgi:hypothetical protein
MNTQNTKQRFFKSGKAMKPTEQRAIEAQEAQEKQSNYPFMRNGTKARFGRFIDAMRNLTREQTQAHEALKEKEAINGSK